MRSKNRKPELNQHGRDQNPEACDAGAVCLLRMGTSQPPIFLLLQVRNQVVAKAKWK
jgi:hypothetical protein